MRCTHPKGAPDGKSTPHAEGSPPATTRAAAGSRYPGHGPAHARPACRRSGCRRGRGRASCAHPGTLVARSTFPELYPVLAPERPPDGKPAPTVVAGQADAQPGTLVARSTFPMLYPVLAPERPPMASRPQRSWPGKLTPNLGPWWPGRRFRCFIRCLHRKGPRMASRPQRSWPGKLTPNLGPWWPGRRFRCFIRCLHRKGPRMASRPQRRNFWQRRSEWYFFSRLLWVFSTCFGRPPRSALKPRVLPQNRRW